jgi:16S rRNA (guanine(1405)-N(7))-methyltransferase
MNKLISKIKEKKSLKNLDDFLVEETVKKYTKEIPDNPKSKEFKRIVKEVRNELNRVYGCFFLKDEMSLNARSSTKERKKIYSNLYKEIFSIAGNPKSILDLSCGYNPLSYEYLNCKPKYLCTEIAKKDVGNLNEWFIKNKIDGKCSQLDLIKSQKFPKADITFLFKTLDILDNKKLAEKIVSAVKGKFVVSFATADLKGRRMNYPRRGWFEQMLKRLNRDYKKLSYTGEVFYLITS